MYGIHRKHLRLCFFSGTSAGRESFVHVTATLFQWIDYFCSFIDSDLAWRIPLFVQCVIGALLAIGSILMPESPRYFSCHYPHLMLELMIN